MQTLKNSVWPKVRKLFNYTVVRYILLAFALNLLVDIMNQRSVLIALERLVTHPLTCLYNMLLILMPLSLAGLFKRRAFATMLLCLPWLVLAVTNFILQGFRNTPLSAVDFILLESVLPIIEFYLSPGEMILIAAMILAALGLLIFAGIKCRKYVRTVRPSLITAAVTAVLLVVSTPALIHVEALSDNYANLTLAYHDYGLPYCFVVSVVDRGIDEPEGYDEEYAQEFLDEIQQEAEENREEIRDAAVSVNSEKAPNVVFLQLESFIDADHLVELTYSQNPTPYFQALKAQYPSGTLTVPTLGAGTVNTEFEVITGMSLDYFGTGEYPYMSVLQSKTCETVAYNLKEHGYFATALHNNVATFYDRNLVFSNMGFDRFVPSEMMIDLEYTAASWAKDKCLLYEIQKALDASDSPDLIYAISVQPHGKYPDSMSVVKDMPIVIEDGVAEEELAAYTYYINQLYEVDLFLKDLTAQLEAYPEPVVLVIYGDHLPNFEIDEEDVLLEDMFKTEYVLWTNYDHQGADRDLNTYQLAAYVLGEIGCDTGVLTQLHQSCLSSENYDQAHEMLEYDMFFGEQYVWDGENPYPQTDLQIGYDDTAITRLEKTEDGLVVYGENFTGSSVVFFNGKKQDTVYIDSHTLMVDGNPKSGVSVTVRQLGKNDLELFESEPVTAQ